jgi:hypothetical protein
MAKTTRAGKGECDVWARGNKVTIFNGETPVITTGIVDRGDSGFMVHLGSGALYFYAGEHESTADLPVNGITYIAKPYTA